MHKKVCYDLKKSQLMLCSIFIIREFKMSIIVSVISVGSAIGAVLFSLWVVKQIFTSN